MRKLLILLSLLSTLLISAPATAAYNPFGQACKAGGAGSTVCTTNGANDPVSGPNGLLKKITLIIATVAGIAAVIIIIISGFEFMRAEGDPQKIAHARSMLLGSVIGLVIIVLAQAILTFVLSRLK